MPSLAAWMPWATADYSPESAVQWMREARAAGSHAFVIRDSDAHVVGTCGLQHADIANRCIQLGYWLGESYTGRSYATRAARLVVAHAVGALALHRVEIIVSVHNRPSQRVAERLGARREATLAERLDAGGTWHDAFLYALTA